MNGSILVSLGFCLLFAYGLFASADYADLARIFPLWASLVGLLLSLVNLGQDLWRAYHHIDGDSGMGLADLETDWDIPHALVWRRAGSLFSIFLILYLAIWLVGYPLAIAGFVILFYRYSVGARWVPSLVAGSGALAFIAFVATVLNLTWPEGLITGLVNLPWPLG